MARQNKQKKSRKLDDISQHKVSKILFKQSLHSKKCYLKHIILFWKNLCLQHYKDGHPETEVSDFCYNSMCSTGLYF